MTENNNDDNLCPHCGTQQKRFTDVVDSGEPFYILGTYCWSCGRFIELDEPDGDDDQDDEGFDPHGMAYQPDDES